MNKELFKKNVYEKYNKELTKKSKRKSSILQKVAGVILVGSLSVTVYAGATGNLGLEKMGFLKLSQNYEESAYSVNKEIENEYFKISLENMAGDSSYIIAEYRIELKDKALKELKQVEYDSTLGYKMGMDYTVFVNSKEITNKNSYVEKISDSEYSYFQNINVMDFEESDLQLEILLDKLYIGDYGIRINESNIEEWRNAGDINEDEIKINEVKIGKKIETNLILDRSQDNTFEVQEQILDNHTKIIIEKVANSKFETYIKIKAIIDNVTWKEYNEDIFEFKSFIITGENGENLPYQVYDFSTYGIKYYKENDNIPMEMEEVYKLKDNDKVRIEENFTILISEQEDNHKIKLLPVSSRMYNDRTDEEKQYYDKATWYALTEGDTKYSAQSGLGGTFEIEKITIDDENVTFYYNENGMIGNEWKIIIRKNNGVMNYIHPTKQEKKGVNSKENKIVFARKSHGYAGIQGWGMTIDEFDNILSELEDLEFTLLFGVVTEPYGEAFEINIPDKNETFAKFENLQLLDM